MYIVSFDYFSYTKSVCRCLNFLALSLLFHQLNIIFTFIESGFGVFGTYIALTDSIPKTEHLAILKRI
jgi:hypothetical protein